MRTIRYEGFEPADISVLNYLECDGVNYHIGDKVEVVYLAKINNECCITAETGILKRINMSPLFPSEARILVEIPGEDEFNSLTKSINVVMRLDIVSSIKMINKEE